MSQKPASSDQNSFLSHLKSSFISTVTKQKNEVANPTDLGKQINPSSNQNSNNAADAWCRRGSSGQTVSHSGALFFSTGNYSNLVVMLYRCSVFIDIFHFHVQSTWNFSDMSGFGYLLLCLEVLIFSLLYPAKEICFFIKIWSQMLMLVLKTLQWSKIKNSSQLWATVRGRKIANEKAHEKIQTCWGRSSNHIVHLRLKPIDDQ